MVEYMYKDNSQLRIEDFVFPYGTLDPENDWVKLAALVPWDTVEQRYAAQFVNNGHPAHPARMAFGALLIKQRLKCSDEWVVKHISENPYLQYFIGMKEYGSSCPFGASTMVAFRKRFSPEDIAEILEATIPKPDGAGNSERNDDDQDPPNGGTLTMDATCCPADIAYPQDIELLNGVREQLECVIDQVCDGYGLKKPRTYRKRARKDYLNLVKRKKRGTQVIRKAIRKQLQYIRRDVRYIAEYVQSGIVLTQAQKDCMNLMTTVYEQQRLMFETGTHSIPRRIVSLPQPWVRPIVRGKAPANTEFGAKLHISLVDGYIRIERLDFEPYNEAEDFYRAVEGYRARYGRYPARILADKLYRNRQTLAYCKERGIRLTGPALGKPPKDRTLTKQAIAQEYQDICDRNEVEGVFGTGKTAYGLGRIAAHLKETTFCVIGVALILMNLTKRLRSLLRLIFCWLLWGDYGCLFFVGLRSEAYIKSGLGKSNRFAQIHVHSFQRPVYYLSIHMVVKGVQNKLRMFSSYAAIGAAHLNDCLSRRPALMNVFPVFRPRTLVCCFVSIFMGLANSKIIGETYSTANQIGIFKARKIRFDGLSGQGMPIGLQVFFHLRRRQLLKFIVA